MISKLFKASSLLVIVLASLGLFTTTRVMAINCSTTAPTTTQEAIQCGTDNSAGVPNGGTPAKDLNNTIGSIINILSAVVGVIAVIMIIVGGFRYITSGGKQESIVSAKNTLLYAVVGLIIVALAQVIVRFVLNDVTPCVNGKTSTGQTC